MKLRLKQGGGTGTRGPLQRLAGWLWVRSRRLGGAALAGTMCYPWGWVKTSPQPRQIEEVTNQCGLAFWDTEVGDSEDRRLKYPGGRSIILIINQQTQESYGEGRGGHMKDMGINSFSCILWGAAPHSLRDLVSWRVCVCVVSRFTCAGLSETPRTVARQAPLSTGFFRQEYLFFSFGHSAYQYGILVPQPEIKLTPPALEVRNLNHWTAMEVPQLHH